MNCLDCDGKTRIVQAKGYSRLYARHETTSFGFYCANCNKIFFTIKQMPELILLKREKPEVKTT